VSSRDLNREAAAVLREAARALGLEGNRAGLARELRTIAQDGPADRTMGNWWDGETDTIPAWALIAAARRAKLSLDDLLATPSRDDRAEILDRLRRLEERLGLSDLPTD
jgi:glutathione S-transferase